MVYSIIILMLFTLPLKKNEDFKKVYRYRRSKADAGFIVFIVKNDNDYSRLGISVSKKVGNSVVRHRIKRLVRECYRNLEKELMTGYDIVVMARQEAKGKDYSSVKSSLCRLFKAHRILIS